MMDKETYRKEIVRMWDSLRTENKGKKSCDDVPCQCCPLKKFVGCNRAQDIFDIVDIVEKWSKEHPPKKYKVSKTEYDILRAAIDYSLGDERFDESNMLMGLLEKGYFNGATSETYIRAYFDNCEVED